MKINQLEAKQTAVMVARDDFLTKIKDMIETLDIQDTHDVKLPNLDAANVSSGGSVRDKKGRAGREAAVAAAAASSALFALKTSVHRLQGSAMEMLSLYTDYTAALENNSLQLKTLYEKESLKLKQMEKSLANLARQHAALERKTSMCITGQGFQADADVDLDEDDDEFEDADASSNRDSQLKQHDEEDAASIDSSGSEAEFFDAMEGEAKAKASIATTAPGTPNKHLSKVSFSTVPHPGSASSNNSTSSTSSNALVPARTATTSSTGISKTPRTALPVFKSDKKLNIWKLIKDAIGKDFSKISMPVILNEPLSALQRFTEDIEYYTILNDAVKQASSLERMVYVTAFAISSYASTLNRTGKPFNPLLGETFEYYDPDNNIALVAEQVSHHPPVSAFHCSGPGWIWWKEVAVQSKFKGKDMEVTPIGWSHVTFPTHGNEHYTWRKVTTAVHNLIVGKLWVENVSWERMLFY